MLPPTLPQTCRLPRAVTGLILLFGCLFALVCPVGATGLEVRVLSSASELDYPPFAVVDEDGSANGFSVELLRAACRAVGMDVTFTVGPWNQIKEDLAQGRIDVLPLVAYSPERTAQFDFSAPYLRLHGTIFVRKGDTRIRSEEDLRDKDVLVMRGDSAHEYALRRNLSERLVLTDTYAEALSLLSKGRHDAVVMQQMVGWQIIKSLGLANIEDVGNEREHSVRVTTPLSDFSQTFCVAVRKGNPELLALVNEGLAIVIANGTYDRLYQKWFGPMLPPPPVDVLATLRYLAMILVPVFLAMALGGVWYLRREVARKTRSLRREIEERRRAEETVRKSEERYELALGAVSDAVWDVDLRTGDVYLSPRWYTMLGLDPQAYPPGFGTWRAIAHPEDKSKVEQVVSHHMSSGKAFEAEVRMRTGGDGWKWILVRGKVVAYDDTGRPLRLLGTHVDISERKRFEDDLRRMRESADAANRAKSAFLASMSHEIRTPLNGIMGLLQLASGTRLDTEQAEYVQAAVQSAQSLTRLLSDILDLSRIEAGKMALLDQPLSLGNVLEAVRELYLPLSRQTEVEFAYDLDPAVPALVSGDGIRLQQVLTNLVGNAFKFTTRGNVRVSVTPLPAPHPEKRPVLFTVSDTGPGMTDERVRELFTPFIQPVGGGLRPAEGAGLGLSICKRLVELMGGTMCIDSVVGAGTTVYFSSVFRAAPDIPLPEEAPEVSAPVPGLRILLVEDDRISRFAASKQLEKAGCTVTAATNGQEGLEELARGEFELVLMDVQMPVLDGLEATRRIRTGPEHLARSHIPIIALTAYAMNGDRERFLAAGMNDYLTKPLNMDELWKAVRRTLKLSREGGLSGGGGAEGPVRRNGAGPVRAAS